MSTDSGSVDAARESLEKRIGAPPRLVFPDGWEFSGAWKRAQAAPAVVGPTDDAAHYDVLLGYEDATRDDLGDRHRVLFAIQDGALRAECDCKAWTYRSWCAHVAVLWWRWCLGQTSVTNLDTDDVHLEPPWWLFVPTEDQEDPL